MWRNFVEKGYLLKGCERNWLVWLLWQTNKMFFLMNELTMTYNIKTLSESLTWQSQKTTSFLQPSQTNYYSALQRSAHCPHHEVLYCNTTHRGTTWSVTSVNIAYTMMWTSATSVQHQATHHQTWRAQSEWGGTRNGWTDWLLVFSRSHIGYVHDTDFNLSS